MRWLALVLTILVIVGSLLGSATITEAHPGGTDGNGCHTCRTNCTESWGISYGFYHRHHPVRPCFASLEPVEPIQPIEPIFPVNPIPRPPSNQRPTASIDGPDEVEAGKSAYFEATGDDRDGYVAQYDWDFGDGTAESDAGAYPRHEFEATGTYKVTLTVIDDDGARATATETVVVTGKKWPISQDAMIGIVIGGVVGLFLLYGIIAAIIDARRSARR